MIPIRRAQRRAALGRSTARPGACTATCWAHSAHLDLVGGLKLVQPQVVVQGRLDDGPRRCRGNVDWIIAFERSQSQYRLTGLRSAQSGPGEKFLTRSRPAPTALVAAP